MKRDSVEKRFAISERIHLAIMEAVSHTARGRAGAIVLQGGVALALVYGSGRRSEDLDFLAADVSVVPGLMRRAQRTLKESAYRDGLFAPDQIALDSTRTDEAKNPLIYTLQCKSPSGRRAEPHVRVKAEFFAVEAALLDQYRYNPIGQPVHASATTVRPLLPVAELEEIYLDKLHAIGLRPYFKYRDVYDLWWIVDVRQLFAANPGATSPRLSRETLVPRLAYHEPMYGISSGALVAQAASERLKTADVQAMKLELSRFINIELGDEFIARMIEVVADEIALWVRLSEVKR